MTYEGEMTLGELIDALEKLPGDMIFPIGFDKPDSYRGYYEQLAFEPAHNISIKTMLNSARRAVGKWYAGYKGGSFQMELDTGVYIAYYGDTGVPLTEELFALYEEMARRMAGMR